MIITREQRLALKRVFDRDQGNDRPTWSSYRDCRRAVQYACFDSCIMINRGDIWLGIERDGYTHS